MQVHVFKTNVQYGEYADHVLAQIRQLDHLMRCNFDLDDCDKILRVETAAVQPADVIRMVRRAGFHCEELGD